MKKILTLLAVLASVCSYTLVAQAQGIAAGDKAAIKKIFRGVDPKLYRIEFNNGREVLGKKVLKLQDLEQVKRMVNPGEKAGWIVLCVEGNGVIYFLAVSGSKWESILGAQKAQQLAAITAKYQR